jgi:hypothetical protein
VPSQSRTGVCVLTVTDESGRVRVALRTNGHVETSSVDYVRNDLDADSALDAIQSFLDEFVTKGGPGSR